MAGGLPRLKRPAGLLRSVLEQLRRFAYSPGLTTQSAPHIRDSISVQSVWNAFVIASLPSMLVGCWSLGHQTNLGIDAFRIEDVPGWRAVLVDWSGVGFDAFSVMACLLHGLLYFLPVFGVALVTGAFWEALFSRVRGRPLDDGLLYIAWFFALLMPATVPLHQVVLGMSFGIVVGKLIYGGSGRYLVNPALLGLAFLVFSYPSLLFGVGAWVPVAGYDQPMVLELVADEGGLKVINAVDYSWWQLFIGDRPGAVGVVSNLGAVLGAAYLVYSGVASWRVMAGSLIGLIAVVLVFNSMVPGNDLFAVPWYWHIVLGGFMFGVVFLATDPVAGPMTDPGRWGFGLLVGGLTAVIRVANPSSYEGVMFAILLACMFSPLIDSMVAERNIRIRRMRVPGEPDE